MAEMTVRLVDAAHTRELRRSVLRPHFAPDDEMPGDEHADALHVAAFAGSSLASACLIFPEPCPWQPGRPAWRLRSMATDPAARGTGAGTAVARLAAETAKDRGAELLWCEARESAVSFYLRCGWQLHGERFSTGYGPHRYMWLELLDGDAPLDDPELDHPELDDPELDN
jgi:GNAT superfamily N-acetyltransferase